MGDVGGLAAASPLSLMSVFEEVCPQYMAMGMSYEQFWDGDVSAHRMFAKAEKQRLLKANRMAWLQGLYIYEALIEVTPYLKAFSKGKPKPYTEEPHDIFADEAKKRKEREDKERYEKMRQKVADFAKSFNEKRKENEMKGVEDNAGCIDKGN